MSSLRKSLRINNYTTIINPHSRFPTLYGKKTIVIKYSENRGWCGDIGVDFVVGVDRVLLFNLMYQKV